MAAECPLCGKPAERSFRPFCSKRCADLDLNQWFKGGYAIPGTPSREPVPGPEEKGPDNEDA